MFVFTGSTFFTRMKTLLPTPVTKIQTKPTSVEKGVTPWPTLAKVMGFVCLIFMGVELTYSVGSRV